MTPMTERTCEPVAILLVDDDPDCRMLIREAIRACRATNVVYEVSSGEEAIQFLDRSGPHGDAPRPGLIYLDLEMPGMNGQEVLKRIRSNRDMDDIAVVMMTGVSDDREMREAAANGANSYTLKPAGAEQFLRTVLSSTQYWLTIHQRPHQPMRGEKAA
jgi:CheY-like chemotaxis protein